MNGKIFAVSGKYQLLWFIDQPDYLWVIWPIFNFKWHKHTWAYRLNYLVLIMKMHLIMLNTCLFGGKCVLPYLTWSAAQHSFPVGWFLCFTLHGIIEPLKLAKTLISFSPTIKSSPPCQLNHVPKCHTSMLLEQWLQHFPGLVPTLDCPAILYSSYNLY